MQPAPFHAALAEGPDGGAAWWLTMADGVRIRIAVWSPKPARGTVFLFPGRTEYVEKYGLNAGELAARGYATLTIDWRGQGLADRALSDRTVGHVDRFADYQHDVRAAVEAARTLGLPRPWHLIAHSMGGTIGLRSVIDGMDVASAVFSAPMWGIIIAPWMRPLVRAFTGASRPIGLGHRLAPGTQAETYVLAAPFDGNTLTRDADMYEYMRRQLIACPDLALAGPSLAWVHEALKETRALQRSALPDLPVACALGSNERIVEAAAIHATVARWPSAEIEIFEGAEHEILMEGPAVRARFLDLAERTFARAAKTSAKSSAAR